MNKIQGYFIFISGSPGASEIGNFLLRNKEYFISRYDFKMKRIAAHETGKYNNVYRAFPALKINNKIYYGPDIINVLSIGFARPYEESEDSHENYMIRNSEFKKDDKSGIIKFNDAADDEEENYDAKIAKKMQEFGKRSARKANDQGVQEMRTEKINYGTEEDFQDAWKRSISGDI